MNSETISIISAIVNIILAAAKFFVGILANSAALIAEGINSGLDIFSSIIIWLGIRKAKKPKDAEHPYGHYRYESLAGFVVVVFLVGSAIWILYEGIMRFINPEPLAFTFWAIIVMAASVIINEIMTRLKFYFGNKFSSIALIADAEHTRADVVSSAGVLIGLLLVKYFLQADAIVAILVGLYILYQSWGLGKEVTDSLLDVADLKLEKKIKNQLIDLELELKEIKTRKVGAKSFAEIKILLDPRLKLDQVTKLTKKIEKILLEKISHLNQIAIIVESHKTGLSTTKIAFGSPIVSTQGIQPIDLSKKGFRTIVPIKNNDIADTFGAKKYLVFDKNSKGKILQKKQVQNRYWLPDSGRGFKFARAASADKVITKKIGKNAKNNLIANNIELKMIKKDIKLKDLRLNLDTEF